MFSLKVPISGCRAVSTQMTDRKLERIDEVARVDELVRVEEFGLLLRSETALRDFLQYHLALSSAEQLLPSLP